MNNSQGFLNYVQINGIRCPRREMYSNITKQFLTGPMMEMCQAIGCLQNPIQKNILAFSDKFLAYICGKHIILHKVGAPKQRIIVKNIQDHSVEQFTGVYRQSTGHFLFALVLNVSSQAAQAQATLAGGKKETVQIDAPPVVRIYQSQSQISFSQIHTHVDFHRGAQIKDMAFIRGGKKLITITNSADRMFVTLWDSKQKVAFYYGEFNLVAWRILGFSTAEDQMFTYNQEYIHTFEFTADQQIKLIDTVSFASELKPREQIRWAVKIKGRPHSAILTSDSRLLFLRGWEVVEGFDLLHQSKQPPFGAEACYVSTYSKGFVVGYELWPRLDILYIDSYTELPCFKYHVDLKVKDFIKCQNIDVSPDESLLVLGVESSSEYIAYTQAKMIVSSKRIGKRNKIVEKEARDNCVISLDVIVMDFQVLVNEQGEKQEKKEQSTKSEKVDLPQTNLMQDSAHRTQILSIAQSLQTGRVVTLSVDRRLKLWASGNNYQLELLKTYQLLHTPKCLDSHPSSFSLAIGSLENLTIYMITDELKPYFVGDIKHCTQVRYSPLGDLLAITCNQNLLVVLKTWDHSLLATFECQYNLIDLQWAYKSTCVILLNSDVEFQCYSLLKRQVIFTQQPRLNGKITCFCYDDIYEILVICTDKGLLYLYQDRMQKLCYQLQIPMNSIYLKAQVSLDLEAIFFLTNLGSVRAYLWPFTNLIITQQDYIEIAMHQSPGSAILLSNQGVVIAGGQDGAIMSAKIELYERGSTVQLPYKPQLTAKLQLCYRPYREEIDLELRDLLYRLENQGTQQKQIQDHFEKQLNKNEEDNVTNVTHHRDEVEYKMKQVNSLHTLQSKQIEVKLRKLRNEYYEQVEKIKTESESQLTSLWEKNTKLMEELYAENENYSKEVEQMNLNFTTEQTNEEIEGTSNFNKEVQKFIKEVLSYESYQHASKELMNSENQEHKNAVKEKVDEQMKDLLVEQSINEKLNVEQSRIKQNTQHITMRIRELKKMVEESTTMLQIDMDRLDIHTEQSNDAQKKLQDIEDQLNTKEMEIRKFNNDNQKLRLHKKVLDYQEEEFTTEVAELRKRMELLQDKEKNMEEKLIKEAQFAIQTTQDMEVYTSQMESKKLLLKNKREQNYNKKRRLEQLEYDLNLAIKENDPTDLHDSIKGVFDKYYGKKIKNQNMNQKEYIDQKGIIQETIAKSRELTSTRNFQSQIMTNSIHQNKLHIKHSDLKTQIYHGHYNRLLEECNELKREHHVLVREVDILTNELHDVNEEIVIFGGRQIIASTNQIQAKSLSPLRSRSASPQLSPIQQTKKLKYENLTPYQQLEVQKEMNKIILASKSSKPLTQQLLATELNNIDVSFKALAKDKLNKDGKIMRVGSTNFVSKMLRQRSISPSGQLLTLQPVHQTESSPQLTLQDDLTKQVKIIKFTNPVNLQRRSPSPRERLDSLRMQGGKLVPKLQRSASPKP